MATNSLYEFLNYILSKEFWGDIFSGLLTFSFAIFLFYLTEKWKNNHKKKQYIENLKSEIDFNISLIKILSDNCGDYISLLSGTSDGVYEPFDFSKYQTNFFYKCLEQGYLYHKYYNNETRDFMAIHRSFSDAHEKQINNFLFGDKKKYGPVEIDTKAAIRFYEIHRGIFDTYIQILESYRNKL